MTGFPKFSALNSLSKKTPKLLDEIKKLAAEGKIQGLDLGDLSRDRLESFMGGKSAGALEGGLRRASESTHEGFGRANLQLEAIVRSVGRPSLLVQDGTYVMPETDSEEVKAIIEGFDRAVINKVIAQTGRVELGNVFGVPYLGTGWIIEKPSERKAIVVTNRHVAEGFASFDGRGGYRFHLTPTARDYVVKVDFKEEHLPTDPMEAPVIKVLFIAGPRDPDIALLEIEGENVKDLAPIELSTKQIKTEMDIGVVGYPANDSRNDTKDVVKIFGDIFDVKRFAFGDIIFVDRDRPEIVHDATTLGGNSGSAVFDRDDGKAVGLHFAGDYQVGNYAVPVKEVSQALAGLTTSVVMPRAGTEAAGDGHHPTAHFSGRDGFNPDFLGKRRQVEMPLPGKWKNDLADIEDADDGSNGHELKYRHFSVVMCESRKLPLITAVNIDGAKSKRLGRVDRWYTDGRLAKSFQTDNDAYSRNPLDRGHMVRREDPIWGSLATAREANIDTFHYTNCAPQHKDLNQRDWVQLENYIIGSARTKNLKVSVFTGPIFKDDDALYRDLVKLPRAFWKIAAVINADTNKLSVTGYILCQGEMIKRLTEAFVYGDFKTYQVPVSLIGKETGLGIDHLAEHDPLASERRREGIESSFERLFVPVGSSLDVII